MRTLAINKWNDVSKEDRELVLLVMREVGSQLRLAARGQRRDVSISTITMSQEAVRVGEALFSAAEELENPTWDDEPAPAPGEIVR